MKVDTRLSVNSTSAALNTDAHAVEHCAVDPATLDSLDSAVGRQLLVRQSSGRLALYTVVASDGIPPPAVEVGKAGRARLGSAPGTAGARFPSLAARITDVALSRVGRFPIRLAGRLFNATVETDFTEGDPPAPRLTEEVLGDDGTGLAILAPHGGRIERHTDEQALSVHKALTLKAKPVRAWVARGFNAGPTGAYKCWHITSSEISEHSFPKLRSLFAPTGPQGPFAHAIAFHGHDDSKLVVGGGLPQDDTHTALKTELSHKIREVLREVTAEPPEVEVRLSGPLAGQLRSNIVNRVTVRGNGIQIEQPLGVRNDPEQREAVARAVTDLYVGRV